MEDTIRLDEIIYSLKSRWKLIVVITLISLLSTGLINFFILTPKYESTAKLFIGKKEARGDEATYNNNDVSMYQNLMKTYTELIKTKTLVGKSLYDANVVGNIDEAMKNLKVEAIPNTQILKIKFKSENKVFARNITNAITNNFIKEAKAFIPNGNIQVIEAPETPKKPVSPRYMFNMIMGLVLGLSFGILFAFLIEFLSNSFKSIEEVERVLDFPVIGSIPREGK